MEVWSELRGEDVVHESNGAAGGIHTRARQAWRVQRVEEAQRAAYLEASARRRHGHLLAKLLRRHLNIEVPAPDGCEVEVEGLRLELVASRLSRPYVVVVRRCDACGQRVRSSAVWSLADLGREVERIQDATLHGQCPRRNGHDTSSDGGPIRRSASSRATH